MSGLLLKISPDPIKKTYFTEASLSQNDFGFHVHLPAAVAFDMDVTSRLPQPAHAQLNIRLPLTWCPARDFSFVNRGWRAITPGPGLIIVRNDKVKYSGILGLFQAAGVAGR